jgi:Concanavalin A-like lectin/glucanases superfamily
VICRLDRSGLVAAAAIAVAGCSFDGSGQAGSGSESDGAPADASATPEADSSTDAASGEDAAPDGELCPAPDDDTIALYRFDDTGDVSDDAGNNDGSLQGGSILAPEGLDGCNLAAGFPPQSESIMVVPNSDDFDLEVGSIDFLVRVPEIGTELGIVSRDADDANQPGHFTILLDDTGRFVARLQADSGQDVICSDSSAVPGQWHHLAINFGAPNAELFLDGVEGNNSDTVTILGGQDFVCNELHLEGIDGNDQPWVFGADNSTSGDGQTDQPRSFFTGGAIDHIRISRARRGFSR